MDHSQHIIIRNITTFLQSTFRLESIFKESSFVLDRMNFRVSLPRFFKVIMLVFLVPVSWKDGSYSFRPCSLRFFISFVLWGLVPVCLGIPSVIENVEKKLDSGFSNVFSSLINYFKTLFQTVCLPGLLGHLVSSIDQELRRASVSCTGVINLILISVSLSVSYLTVIASHGFDNPLAILRVFHLSICGFTFMIALIVVNMITSSYCLFCKLEPDLSLDELVNKAEDCLNKYVGLKAGLSPFLFIVYSLQSLTLVTECYRVLEMESLISVLINTGLAILSFLVILNLSLVTENCHDALKSNNKILR